MTKIIQFGKIAYTGKSKNYPVELIMELEERNGIEVFTVCANVWNTKHTDGVMGGQCLEEIWNDYCDQLDKKYLYRSIMQLWKKWHLNDLHAECQHQEQEGMTWDTHPLATCEVCGWVLGRGWSARPIDPKDLESIKNIMENN